MPFQKNGDHDGSCDALNRIIDEVTDIKLLGLNVIPNGDILIIGHTMQRPS